MQILLPVRVFLHCSTFYHFYFHIYCFNPKFHFTFRHTLNAQTFGVMRRSSSCSKFLTLVTDKLLIMRTLNIAISDLEYEKFGLKSDQLSFTDFVDMIS